MTSLGPSDFTAKDYWQQPAPVCLLYLGNLGGLRLMPCIQEQHILCVQLNLLYQSNLVPTDLKDRFKYHDHSITSGQRRARLHKTITAKAVGWEQYRLQKPPRATCVVCQHRNKSLSVPLSTHHLSYFLPLGSSNSAKFISLGHVYG